MKRFFVVLLIVVMAIWVHVPDWWWATHVPAGSWFTGQASWVDQIDLPQYFRVIRMGMEQGSFQIVNFADSRATDRAVIYPVYTLIGMLARFMTHDPILTFHVVGAITGTILMVVAFWFVGLFIKDDRWKLIGWYWLFLAGGIGWLGYPQDVFPDIGVPIFNLWSALRYPHEALTMIALMGFLGCTYLFFYEKRNEKNRWWGMGLATVVILLNHPQTIVPLGLIGGMYGIISAKKRGYSRWWQWVFIVVGTFVGYYLLVGKMVLSSSMAEGLRSQGTYVFSVWYWLAGWGMVGIFMLYGWKKYTQDVFLRLWLVVQIALFYLPFVPYRGMMIRGVWIAVILLAVRGAELLAKKYAWNNVWVGAAVMLLSMGDIVFIYNKRMDLHYMQKSAFVSQLDGAMMEYLQSQGKYGEGIIGSYRMANLAMGYTRLSPYAGHYPFTPHFLQRYPEVVRFYQGKMMDEEAKTWLKENNVLWVMMGNEERQLARTSALSYSFLKEVWQDRGVRVYQSTF